MASAGWQSTAWITCDVRYPCSEEQRARRRYTVLFLHDEAVALAAGHRPCGHCRRADYQRFVAAWTLVHGSRPSAAALDEALHDARLDGTEQRTHRAPWSSLPEGTFVALESGPAVASKHALVGWSSASEEGYEGLFQRPEQGEATVLTPAPVVEVLRAGYRPQISSEVERVVENG